MDGRGSGGVKSPKIRTRLSPEMVLVLRRLWKAGVCAEVIGDELAMSHPTVRVWAKELGLPPRRRGGQSGPHAGSSTVKQRKCLKCDNMFASEHVGNRVCRECKDTVRGLGDNDFTLKGPAAGCAE